MTSDFVTQEQLNLKLNTLRYEIGMTIERTVTEQVAEATRPLENRFGLIATNAENALTGVMKLNAELKAAIGSRNREIADINAAIRDVGRDAARGVSGLDMIQDTLKEIKETAERQYQSVMTVFQKHETWIAKRSAIEQAALSSMRIFLPTLSNLLRWGLVLLVSGGIGLFLTLLRYIR